MTICYLPVTQEFKEYNSYQKADNRLLIKKIDVGLWDLMIYYCIYYTHIFSFIISSFRNLRTCQAFLSLIISSKTSFFKLILLI